MKHDPGWSWAGKELAERLGIPTRNMLTQLAEWVRYGFLFRTAAGGYSVTGARPCGPA